jgi:hypothetical protein
VEKKTAAANLRQNKSKKLEDRLKTGMCLPRVIVFLRT